MPSIDMLNHVGVLREAVAQSPNATLFELAPPNPKTDMWVKVSFSQFNDHVYQAAYFWQSKLSSVGVARGDVVAIWVPGTSYEDVVQLMSLFIAGYTPQCFALKPNAVHVKKLVEQANAKALIVSPENEPLLGSVPFSLPIFPGFQNLEKDLLSKGLGDYAFVGAGGYATGDTIAAILHTGGTVSGTPKIVPLAYKWLYHVTNNLRDIAPSKGKLATLWPGSVCHISTFLLLLSSLRSRATIVQIHEKPLTSAGLITLTEKTSTNRALTYGYLLEKWIQDARTKPEVLKVMQELALIRYTGVGITQADYDWALDHGIRLSSIFVSTEAGLMMYSTPDGTPQARYLRELPNNPMMFRKTDARFPKPDGSAVDLYELVIPQTSPNIPVPSLRDPDGNYATGDLMEKVAPGFYESRGRGDNFFKHRTTALWVAAGALEESLKTLSPSIVSNVIVVGPTRPYLTCVIEPVDPAVASLSPKEQYKLKQQIVADQAAANAVRFDYEIIDKPERMVFIQPGRLPRTPVKGSIQRRQVESVLEEEMRILYPDSEEDRSVASRESRANKVLALL